MSAAASTSIERELGALLGSDAVLPGSTRAYLSDATESRNLRGKADAIALPAGALQVARVVGWCYEHDVPIVPRDGGTGYTGGAVPLDGGVVVSLERLNKIRHLDPGLWRAAPEPGMTTSDLRRRARENGLLYPPDPGSAGDGNLHSTFMIDLDEPAELERAEQAAEDLFALAAEVGGSISGEHGVGLVKGGQLTRQWEAPAIALHEAIKRVFDPKDLLNPGKKLARAPD